jgi:hypothetical protein
MIEKFSSCSKDLSNEAGPSKNHGELFNDYNIRTIT